MRKNVRFYNCKLCGNTIGLIHGEPEHIECCGEQMKRLEANEKQEYRENHIPEYIKENNEIIVKLEKDRHPMEKEHYIMWVALLTSDTTIRVRLEPQETKEVRFPYIPSSTLYAYCNKHGLWEKEVE